jgi:hypothetical protein
MILAREPILRSSYYPDLILCFVLLLVVVLFCTLRRINLFLFIFFFLRAELFLLFLLFWVEGISLNGSKLGYICFFILCWLFFLYWLEFFMKMPYVNQKITGILNQCDR